MCSFFSCIVMKNKKVIWEPGIDGHHVLLERNKIPDNTDDQAKMKFARVEILPPDEGYVFERDLAKWYFRIDENIRPEWFSPAHQEAAMVSLADCLSQCVIDGGEFEKIEGKSGLYLRNVTIKMLDNSTVQAMCGNSTVQEMWDNSTVQAMRDNSTVQVYSPRATFTVCGEMAVAISRINGELKIHTKK